jgi:hypothetical protein
LGIFVEVAFNFLRNDAAFLCPLRNLKTLLDAWPLLERLFRLSNLLALMTLAACFAIRWASQSMFRGYILRVPQSSVAADSSEFSPPNGISLGRACRLFGAHIWRYAIVVLPVNFLLGWLFVGTDAPENWLTVLKVQTINFSVGFVAGIWAMRASLKLAYRGFHFQWVSAQSSATPIDPRTPAGPSAEH